MPPQENGGAYIAELGTRVSLAFMELIGHRGYIALSIHGPIPGDLSTLLVIPGMDNPVLQSRQLC